MAFFDGGEMWDSRRFDTHRVYNNGVIPATGWTLYGTEAIGYLNGNELIKPYR